MIFEALQSNTILALNCPRCKIGQVSCSDMECPECSSEFIQIEPLDRIYAVGVIAQNVLGQLPSTDSKKILTEEYGAFDLVKLDKSKLSRGRKFFINYFNELFYFS